MPVSFENRNFQKELDKKLELIKKEEKVPTLLLHSCCAPCSSYVIEYLSDYFNVTVFYYNPNISQDEEYCKRVHEQQRFIKEFPAKYPVSFIMNHRSSLKMYEAMKNAVKVANDVLYVTACVLKRQHSLQNK